MPGKPRLPAAILRAWTGLLVLGVPASAHAHTRGLDSCPSNLRLALRLPYASSVLCTGQPATKLARTSRHIHFMGAKHTTHKNPRQGSSQRRAHHRSDQSPHMARLAGENAAQVADAMGFSELVTKVCGPCAAHLHRRARRCLQLEPILLPLQVGVPGQASKAERSELEEAVLRADRPRSEVCAAQGVRGTCNVARRGRTGAQHVSYN